MDFGLAFALGILGSLHCAAMCGPLQLALPVPDGGGAGRFIAGRIIYQLGRVATYCALGLVAGLVGKSIYLAGLQRWVSIGLGVAVLAGFFISKKIAVSAPVARFVMWLQAAMSVPLRKRNLSSLALLGMLNGLLPCGLVYVALAGASVCSAVWSAIAYMAAFGFGTLPMMLALGLSGKMFPPALRLKLRAAIPAGVCLLAALLILRGLSLGIPYISPDLSSGASCCSR
ncbi:MAG: sulfite exporter TauE/SafE family protein [Verrucomicrobiota bacterium]